MTNTGRTYTPQPYEPLESGCRRLYRAGPLRELAEEHDGKYLLLARDTAEKTRKICVSIGYDIGGPFLGGTPDDAMRAFSLQKPEGVYVATRFPIVLGGLDVMLEYIQAAERQLGPLPVRSADYGRKRKTSMLSEREILERAGLRQRRTARRSSSLQHSPWDIVVAALFGVDIRP